MASSSTPRRADCYWRLPLVECREQHTHTHTLFTDPRHLVAYLWPHVKTFFSKIPGLLLLSTERNTIVSIFVACSGRIKFQIARSVFKQTLLECSPQETWPDFRRTQKKKENPFQPLIGNNKLRPRSLIPTWSSSQFGFIWGELVEQDIS